MPKHLPVPKDLEHLLEKRDAEEDRRQKKRRKKLQLEADYGKPASKPERRQTSDRRRKRRRKADS